MVIVALATALAGSGSPASVGTRAAFVVLTLRPGPHPTRTKILEHLRILPGDHLRSIARTLRISLSGARYHLHILHRGGLVREDKVRHHARYYAADPGAQAEKNVVFAKHWEHRDLRARVLRTVESRGGAGPSQVARQMGISRQLATYHLVQLAASGRLMKEAGVYRIGPSLGRAYPPSTSGFPPEMRP